MAAQRELTARPEPTAQRETAGDTDLAAIGAVLAEPSRAKILLALADGRSLPASMLAAEAGVTASTASHHLARLVDAGLLTSVSSGRHRYFTLAGPHVGELIEAVARVAPAQPVRSLRQGTRAHALRYARHCYDHLAGRLGVAVADALRDQGVLTAHSAGAGLECRAGPGTSGRSSGDCRYAGYTVTADGAIRLAKVGVDAQPGEVARCCVDWTEQRPHIAGPLGRALMTCLLESGWLTRSSASRALHLTDAGRAGLPADLGVALPDG
jgi:DNA-binding transcriptional ArsR family regulator